MYLLAGVVIAVCVVPGIVYAFTEAYERRVLLPFSVYHVPLGALIASYIPLCVMEVRDYHSEVM